MARKQTNLAVAADVATIEEMLRIADQVTAHKLVCSVHSRGFDVVHARQWSTKFVRSVREGAYLGLCAACMPESCQKLTSTFVA